MAGAPRLGNVVSCYYFRVFRRSSHHPAPQYLHVYSLSSRLLIARNSCASELSISSASTGSLYYVVEVFSCFCFVSRNMSGGLFTRGRLALPFSTRGMRGALPLIIAGIQLLSLMVVVFINSLRRAPKHTIIRRLLSAAVVSPVAHTAGLPLSFGRVIIMCHFCLVVVVVLVLRCVTRTIMNVINGALATSASPHSASRRRP